MLPYESLQFEVWGEETKDAYRRRAQAVADREVVSGTGPVGNAVQDALEASASDEDAAVKSALQDTAAGYGRFGDPEYYDVLTAEQGGRYREHTRDLLDATTEDQIRLYMCRRHRQCADDPFEPRPLTALERGKDDVACFEAAGCAARGGSSGPPGSRTCLSFPSSRGSGSSTGASPR